MFLASSNDVARASFKFIATWPGQLLLAVVSVAFLVVVKNLTRQPGKGRHPFRLDDLSIGLDLIVLSIITLLSYAASQYTVEQDANPKIDPSAASAAQEHETNAMTLAFWALLMLLFVTWIILWLGQFSVEEQSAWKVERLKDLQKKNPAATALELEEAPRFKRLFGLLVPGIIGFLVLLMAIRSAVA